MVDVDLADMADETSTVIIVAVVAAVWRIATLVTEMLVTAVGCTC